LQDSIGSTIATTAIATFIIIIIIMAEPGTCIQPVADGWNQLVNYHESTASIGYVHYQPSIGTIIIIRFSTTTKLPE
jgi:hypothetical protein